MELGRKHRGARLICRTAHIPIIKGVVHLLVEDPEGTVERLYLLNFKPELCGCQEVDILKLLPVGQILLIKEPGYRLGRDLYPVIYCENPSNVVLLQPDDPALDRTPWAHYSVRKQNEPKSPSPVPTISEVALPPSCGHILPSFLGLSALYELCREHVADGNFSGALELLMTKLWLLLPAILFLSLWFFT